VKTGCSKAMAVKGLLKPILLMGDVQVAAKVGKRWGLVKTTTASTVDAHRGWPYLPQPRQAAP